MWYIAFNPAKGSNKAYTHICIWIIITVGWMYTAISWDMVCELDGSNPNEGPKWNEWVGLSLFPSGLWSSIYHSKSLAWFVVFAVAQAFGRRKTKMPCYLKNFHTSGQIQSSQRSMGNFTV